MNRIKHEFKFERMTYGKLKMSFINILKKLLKKQHLDNNKKQTNGRDM